MLKNIPKNFCPECGDQLQDRKTCQDHFNQMLAWDFEDFEGAGQVHHLTVLCYHLQHPSLYSQEALKEAQKMLKEIIENDFTGQELYEKNRKELGSQKRTWKFKGSPENHSSYLLPTQWPIKASEVVGRGVKEYPENVKKWAQSIHETLKNSENFLQII